MSNGDRIRAFSDEQLARFLLTWKKNSIASFLRYGCQEQMIASEIIRWIKASDGFVCMETKVGSDMLFDQEFNLAKQEQ